MRDSKKIPEGDSTMQRITAEDSAIIARYQSGTTAAFDDLVAKHRQRAYQYASRLTNNPDEAADIVSETFLRVYRSLHGFKGDSSFTTWLYRIETNCFLDIRKRTSSRPTFSIDDPQTSDDGQFSLQVIDCSESAFQLLERSERMHAIEAALRRLPDHQRSILVMYHIQAMSYEDIAAALRLPMGTVKSRLNRARLSLRGLLRPCRNLFGLPKARPQALAGA